MKNFLMKGKLKITMLAVAVMTMLTSAVAFAGEPTPVPGVETGIFDTIVDGAEKGAHLFTIYPVNIFLGASILMLGVGVLFAFKKRAKS